MSTIPQEGVEHSEPQSSDSDDVSQQYHGLCSLAENLVEKQASQAQS